MSKTEVAALRIRPRMGPKKAGSDYSGLSATTLWRYNKKGWGLFVKAGSRTLVDFDALDRLLDSLKAASSTPDKQAA